MKKTTLIIGILVVLATAVLADRQDNNGNHFGWPNHGITAPGMPNHYGAPGKPDHP